MRKFISISASVFAISAFLLTTNAYSQNDWDSKVEKHKFSVSQSKQERELKKNSTMLRFAQSREELSWDRHRPIYHFLPPEGRLNDPNGLCFWNGKWHMFYQAYPPADPRQHWGHAVSDDLVNWRDLPYAIYPGPEEKVYSGTCWVENDRVIAMYRGVGLGEMVAVSSDPLLLNWEKLTGDAVIKESVQGKELPFTLFDPCIWKKGDNYYCIIGGVQQTGPGGKNVHAEYLFRSENLTDWEYMHQFVENNMYSIVGDDGACPYFWPIGDNGKYILLYFSHKSGAKYLIGDYDTSRDKFVVTNGGNFNNGPSYGGGIHAPSGYPDGKGGVYVIFNTNSGKPIGNGNFTETMTLPWLLTLDEEDNLLINPVEAIEGFRGRKVSLADIDLPANTEILLDGINGKEMEMNFVIDLGKAPGFEIDVFRSPDKEEYTRILFYKDRGYVTRENEPPYKRKSAISIDTSMGSTSPVVRARPAETTDVFIGKDEKVNLRIFIDRSIVEVFVNGRQCLCVRTYPDKDDSNGVSIRAQGKDARLVSAEAWTMNSIYE